MSAGTFNLAEALRLMQDPALCANVVALVTAMHANDTSHPSVPTLPVVPFAIELAESPERAVAALLQLGALLVAALGATGDVTATLQRWALLP